jgi:hypothetical protein
MDKALVDYWPSLEDDFSINTLNPWPDVESQQGTENKTLDPA